MPTAFDRATDAAFAAMKSARDIRKVPAVLRTIAMIYSAQGIIDNGGLQYFFEQDFPGKPPYEFFVEAYRAIGADDIADALEKAIALFPFANPHKHKPKRNQFLDSFNSADGKEMNSPFEPLTDQICGNEQVWPRLKQFAKANAKELRELEGNS